MYFMCLKHNADLDLKHKQQNNKPFERTIVADGTSLFQNTPISIVLESCMLRKCVNNNNGMSTWVGGSSVVLFVDIACSRVLK